MSTVGELGSLLGLLPELKLGTASVALRPGDTSILYTDGVTDVPPPNDLDADRLNLLVQRAAEGAASAEIVADRLGRFLHELLPVARRNDDVAIVVARVAT